MPMLTRKIFTANIKEIKTKGGRTFLYGKEIERVELMGICFEHGDKFIKILDYYSEIILFKKPETQVTSERCLFKCKLYVNDSKVSLFCTEVSKIDFYGEMFFIVEAQKLNEKEKEIYREKEGR